MTAGVGSFLSLFFLSSEVPTNTRRRRNRRRGKKSYSEEREKGHTVNLLKNEMRKKVENVHLLHHNRWRSLRWMDERKNEECQSIMTFFNHVPAYADTHTHRECVWFNCSIIVFISMKYFDGTNFTVIREGERDEMFIFQIIKQSKSVIKWHTRDSVERRRETVNLLFIERHRHRHREARRRRNVMECKCGTAEGKGAKNQWNPFKRHKKRQQLNCNNRCLHIYLSTVSTVRAAAPLFVRFSMCCCCESCVCVYPEYRREGKM